MDWWFGKFCWFDGFGLLKYMAARYESGRGFGTFFCLRIWVVEGFGVLKDLGC
jgi:hypothetical protein